MRSRAAVRSRPASAPVASDLRRARPYRMPSGSRRVGWRDTLWWVRGSSPVGAVRGVEGSRTRRHRFVHRRQARCDPGNIDRVASPLAPASVCYRDQKHPLPSRPGWSALGAPAVALFRRLGCAVSAARSGGELSRPRPAPTPHRPAVARRAWCFRPRGQQESRPVSSLTQIAHRRSRGPFAIPPTGPAATDDCGQRCSEPAASRRGHRDGASTGRRRQPDPAASRPRWLFVPGSTEPPTFIIVNVNKSSPNPWAILRKSVTSKTAEDDLQLLRRPKTRPATTPTSSPSFALYIQRNSAEKPRWARVNRLDRRQLLGARRPQIASFRAQRPAAVSICATLPRQLPAAPRLVKDEPRRLVSSS